ncbi:TIGR03857 family LLM class F420-dependent oxidoreductase [Nocardia sp. R6R-6]|uniref:TIGR03857 family LLM class F420-dependent oxidoreductase n=1 Tax=Nocardia sp. R6R-6 TaxID=3459303 RepID=UPI00403D5D67
MPETGFYTLAGQAENPRDLIGEVRTAEELGIGECFISERFSTKEAATICGAVGAVSEKIRITTGATNHNIRHPIVTASFATTMHRLTGGRFALGIGRGIADYQRAFGMHSVTTAQMAEFALVMRKLFRGLTVTDYAEPMGRFPALRLDPNFDEDIKLALVAIGPNSLELGGRVFDKVILHTAFTDETLEHCVRIVKRAAETAGRDPAEVEVWACPATIGDHLPEELRLRKLVGRLATYLQGSFGDLLVRTNNWDPRVIERFNEDPVVQSFYSPTGVMRVIDSPTTSIEDLEHIAKLLPDEWLAAAATGSAQECAATIKNKLDLGADGVIMHGASPAQLAPIISAYRSIRKGAN